jgi:hypothetical protein
MFSKGGLAYDLGVLFALGLVAANYQAFNTLAQTAFNGVSTVGSVIQGRGPSAYGNPIAGGGGNLGFSNIFGNSAPGF